MSEGASGIEPKNDNRVIGYHLRRISFENQLTFVNFKFLIDFKHLERLFKLH